VDGPVKEWLDTLFEGVQSDARILEIGSAFGRDAKYIESMGYSVHRTDASSGFVGYLRANGEDAETLNVLTDTIDEESFDVIFADAVFLHFTKEEFISALKNVHTALLTGGRLGLTLKNGDGEEITRQKMNDDRYFRYWRAPELASTLSEAAFKNISIGEAIGGKWLHVFAEK
jgi:cyclopropane fatty-acyl-phospholipid synthase-like methyltransferase